MRKLIASLLAIVLLCLPDVGHALRPDRAFHHYVRGNWSIQDGLPQISASSIAQDRDGYLWVGTFSGLARFDGVRFVSYTPESAPGLPGVWIRALHLARDGKLWVGTYKGVAVYDGKGFTPMPAADAQRWPVLEITAFAEDVNGRMWVATTSGVFRADTGRLHAVPGSPTLAQSLLTREDGMWVGTRGAVHRVTTGDRWQTQLLPEEVATTAISRLVETQGRLWAATALGLFTRGPEGWKRFDLPPQLTGALIGMLYADSDGNLWAGGDTGLVRIRDGHVTEFIDPAGPGGIPDLRVAFEDREKNLWLGSQSEGVTRLRDSWTRRFSTPEGLGNRLLWAVARPYRLSRSRASSRGAPRLPAIAAARRRTASRR